MMEGIVKRVAGGIFVVLCNGNEYTVHSPGKIKLAGKLVVGDVVEFNLQGDKYVIASVQSRKNCFIRPQAANIDIFLIVSSLKEPRFDRYLTDKLTVYAKMCKTEPVILFSKADLDRSLANNLIDEYRAAGINAFCSEYGKHEYDELKKILRGKLVLLVGNSGVGKSTFLNQLFGSDIQLTNFISMKLGRGKHTTRHTEIFERDGFYIIDTPGFSSLDLNLPDEGYRIGDYFPEMVKLGKGCRFATCNHINEPNCKVKKAVEEGIISKDRYNSYIRLFNEMKLKEERRW